MVKALDSHARGCGLKSCLAQDKDCWWGKVTGAHLHKCVHSPGHCPLWLGNRLHSKSSMSQKIVGDIDVPEKTYLIECCVTETMNQSIICMKIDGILRKLDIARENFLLFLLDAASYVTACTATLKVLYPRLFHVTCLAYMLHNCAEKVRNAFDNLVARVKAATIKNKSRQAQFKHIRQPSGAGCDKIGHMAEGRGLLYRQLD